MCLDIMSNLTHKKTSSLCIKAAGFLLLHWGIKQLIALLPSPALLSHILPICQSAFRPNNDL